MKKTLLVTAIASVMCLATTSADAAITGMTAGNYTMSITGGCFDFGNCITSGKGALTDNTTQNQANTSSFGTTPTYGSGIINDGLMGVINFHMTSTGTIDSVTSYSQDSYLNTAGGTFYLRSANLATMGGSINQTSGAMSFDPTGRVGLAAKYLTALGEQDWNRDNTSNGLGTGNYDQWTTVSSSNRAQGLSSGFTVNGSNLVNAGANTWTGTLVSAGNIGQGWGGFDNQQYAEQFNVKISAVPVPAALWLFGSGLLGLVGVARRRKQA